MLGKVASSLALAVLLVCAGTATKAEEAKPDFAQAKKHFRAGQAFLQMERFADAVAEFQKAYEITKDGLVMGQVALTYEKAGDFESALKAIKIYRESLPEEERASADEIIKKYEKLIQEGRSKKLELPKAQPEAAEVEEPETTRPAATVEEEQGKGGRFYTWIAAGAAGALAISALVVGLNAQSKFDELSDECKPLCEKSEVDSVRTRALVTDILWGTAAAAAITAGVLYFLEGRSGVAETAIEPPEEGDEEELEEEEEWSRRIQVTPVVGGGTYGLGAGIRF